MRIKKSFVTILAFIVWSLSACQNQPVSKEDNLTQSGDEVEGIKSDRATDYPALNVVTDNPVLGDESRFVRIAPWKDDGVTNLQDFQTGEVTIEAGKSYAVMIYYHNAADLDLDAASNAVDTVLLLTYPETMQKGETNAIAGNFAYGDDLQSSMIMDWVNLVAADDFRLQPGIIMSGTEPEYCAMLCDNYGENWSVQNPAVNFQDGVASQFFMFENIAPGYDGAGFVFLKLDAVAE